MNRQTAYKYILIITLFSGVFLTFSCKDGESYDVSGDSQNKVYFPLGGYTMNTYAKYSFSITHTPAGSIGGDISVTTPVLCTQPASADLKVSLSVNNSLVDAYNAEKGVKYSRLPDAIADFEASELTIQKGGLASSDSLKISIPGSRFLQLTDSVYLIPLEISSVTGDKIAGASSNRGVLYVIIRTIRTNSYNNSVAADMTGSLASPRSSWTAVTSIVPSSGTPGAMFDGSTSSYWALSPSRMVNFTVDLKSAFPSITGIRLHTSSTTYSLTVITISSSADGDTWTPQGTARLSTASSYQYVKFYSPVSARYIKVDINGWRSTSSIRVSEFDIYRSN